MGWTETLFEGFKKRWGLKGGEKRKACRGDSKKKKKSVCAWDSVGEGGGVWGTRLLLETSEKLGSVNYVKRIHDKS